MGAVSETGVLVPVAEARFAPMEALAPLMAEAFAAGRCVRFSPRGTSMLPLLRQGRDAVTLAPPPSCLHVGDVPLYRRDSGAYVLHRVVALEPGGTYACCGDNQTQVERGVRPDQVVAVVAELQRAGHRIAVESQGYRAYWTLWTALLPVRRVLLRAKALVGRAARRLGFKT